MARSAEQRLNSYTAKVVPSKIATDFTNMKSMMVDQMTTVAGEQVQLEHATKGVLAGLPELTVLYPAYMAFVKKLYKKQQSAMGGATLKTFGDALSAYYVSVCGCTALTLKALALEVLGISLT